MLAISPDGRRLAMGGFEGKIRIHDLATGDEVRTLVGHAGSPRGLAFSPDGERLYFSSRTGGVTYEVTGPFKG